MQPVGALGGAATVETLEGELRRGQRVGVEQLAELGLAEDSLSCAESTERACAPLRQRRVAVVDEARHVREHQRGREGRGRARVHRDHADAPLPDLREDLHQAGEIEDVAEALAVRLQDQQERSVARGHREQIRRALARGPSGDRCPG